ncbi:MAG TPA: hypothetical protein VEP48_05075 [Methylomirabilota bacterium]|nr:hypothetical protein [Methylomirabilota bacterium]
MPLGPAQTIRDLDEAVEAIGDYVFQVDNLHATTRTSAWQRIERAIADYKRVKRKVKRQETQILELQATLRKMSRHSRPPGDPGSL